MANEEGILSGGELSVPLPDGSIGEYLLDRLRQHGNKVAHNYLDDGRKLTYSQLADRACSIAEEMRARGIEVGDVVATCCPVCPEFTTTMLGSFFTGSVLATLNPLYDQHDFNHLLPILAPKIIFTVPQAEDTIRLVLSKLNSKSEVIVFGEKSTSWLNFLRHKDSSKFQPAKLDKQEDLLALIMISSGTTGFPKGVTVTYKSVFLETIMLRERKDFLSSQDRLLLFSPPFWITAPLFYSHAMDLRIEIFTGAKFTEELFCKTVQENKVTVAFLPPNLILSLAKTQATKKYDISSLRFILGAGSAMSKDAEIMAETELGVAVAQAYGLTEVLFISSATPSVTTKPGTTGKLLVNKNCKVVDVDTGLQVGPNTEGELCFKGPTLTQGYYRNPTDTANAIDKDGWFHTGDVGYYDENGLLYVVDRIKDLIKYRGHHLAPVEIESLILEHPGVKDVAVIGVKHDLDMEHPMAVVVRQPGSNVSEQELVQLVASRVAEHKWLRAGVCFRDNLPKTLTGKIQRREVRRLVAEGKSNQR